MSDHERDNETFAATLLTEDVDRFADHPAVEVVESQTYQTRNPDNDGLTHVKFRLGTDTETTDE